jgi:hypothetical protein
MPAKTKATPTRKPAPAPRLFKDPVTHAVRPFSDFWARDEHERHVWNLRTDLEKAVHMGMHNSGQKVDALLGVVAGILVNAASDSTDLWKRLLAETIQRLEEEVDSEACQSDDPKYAELKG